MTQKPVRTKGPIRIEAILPFLIISSLIGVYFTLFFDSHLRRGLEYGLTQANGAEVNIASVKTSFIRMNFEVRGLQFTDAQIPMQNQLELEAVRADLHVDALLRAKFVLELMSVDNIQVHTPRKSAGKVLPPAPPGKLSTEFEKMKAEALAKAQSQFSESALGQVGETLKQGISTDALKGLTVDQLKSVAKIEALQTQIDSKQKEWNQTLQTLPGEKDFEAIKSRISAVQIGGNPAEIPQKVAQLTSLIQESNQKVQTLTEQSARLQTDVGALSSEVSKIDQWIAQDQRDLESKLKLPSLDAKNLSNELFGNQLKAKVAQVGGFAALARKYMPPKKEAKPTFFEHERGEGRTYSFGRTNGYPIFWVKKILVSSEAKHSPFGGDIKGSITHLSTEPRLVGKPTAIKLEGSFPAQNILGVKVEGELDHTGDVPKQRLVASVASFPVAEQKLSDSGDVKLAIAEATGTASVKAQLEGDQLDLTLQSQLSKIKPVISATNAIVAGVIKAAFSELAALQLTARAYGPWSDLTWDLTSNLAGALERGFQKQLSSQLAEARARIAQLVQGQVASKKKAVTDQFENQKTLVLKQVESRKKQAEALKAQAESRVAEVKSQANAVKGQAVDQLKKRFKF